MVKNVLLGFGSVALAIASAATTYNVTFYEPVTINGTQVKPGSYKLELEGNKALIRPSGEKKTVTEAPVKVENEERKFSSTTIRMDGTQVDEIRLGGTTTKLVFEKSSNATN
jgi:hypothetical protein